MIARTFAIFLLLLVSVLASCNDIDGDDVILEKSRMTGQAAAKHLENETATKTFTRKELYALLKTTPVQTNEFSYRWDLADGHLLTGFVFYSTLQLNVITSYEIQSDSFEGQGGPLHELGELTTYYYKQPQPDKVAEMLANASRYGILENPAQAGPFYSFLAQVYKQHPDRVEEWIKQGQNLPESDRAIMYRALWWSGTAQAQRLIANPDFTSNKTDRALLTKMQAENPPDILSLPVQSPSQVDQLWGAFLGSGDRRYVERIIALIGTTEVTDDNSVLVSQVSEWSLASNIRQHELVRKICEEVAENADSPQQSRLKKLLEESPDKVDVSEQQEQ